MVQIIETIDVDVPVRTAYNQWTQFESFPQFLDEVESITQIDDTHNHWKVQGRRRRARVRRRDHRAAPRRARRVAQHRRRHRARRRRDVPQARATTRTPRDRADRLGARRARREGRLARRRRTHAVKKDLKNFKEFIENAGRRDRRLARRRPGLTRTQTPHFPSPARRGEVRDRDRLGRSAASARPCLEALHGILRRREHHRKRERRRPDDLDVVVFENGDVRHGARGEIGHTGVSDHPVGCRRSGAARIVAPVSSRSSRAPVTFLSVSHPCLRRHRRGDSTSLSSLCAHRVIRAGLTTPPSRGWAPP